LIRGHSRSYAADVRPNRLTDSLFRVDRGDATEDRVPQALRPRHGLSILPFAEIYTVIDLVSIDAEGGSRESPVHLEGHRLVHDRLVG
jgi:hypothetical protein